MVGFGITCGVILALAGMATATPSDNLLVNGSFETGDYTGNPDFQTLGNGSSAIDGWTVIGSVDWINHYWQPADGSRSVDLDGNFPGGVAQTFDTTPGQTYHVSFALSGNPDGPPTVKVAVATAGTVINKEFQFTVSPDQTKQNMMWQPYGFNFTAGEGRTTTISFMGGTENPGCYGAALDNVSVTPTLNSMPVPEPITMIGAFMGLSGLGLYVRKRTKVAA